MSQAYRPVDEQMLLELRALRRDVQALQRAGAGQASMQSVASGSTSITATGPPGTTITGPSVTIVRPGRYLLIATFDFSASATGWTAISGAHLKNGAEVTPNERGVLRDTGVAVVQSTHPVISIQNLVAGDVMTLGAWKSAAGGTITTTSNTQLFVVRMGPT